MPVALSSAPRSALLRLSATAVCEHAPFVANARVSGGRFTARLITPGLVNYRDVGKGVAYVPKQTIDRCVNSYVGCPLILRHKPRSRVTGQVIDRPGPQHFEEVACGFIDTVTYNAEDGWYYASGTCTDEEAKKKVTEDGWRVSCAYAGTEPLGPGGTLNGMRYDYERRGFSGEHLAIEPPDKVRYEAATIVLNSKAATQGNVMFKSFAKKTVAATSAAASQQAAADAAAAAAAASASTTLNATEVTPETAFEYAPGKTLSLGELAANQVRIDAGELTANAAPAELDPQTEIAYRADRPEARMTLGDLCKNAADAEDADEADKAKKKKEDEDKVKNAKDGKKVLRLSNFSRVADAAARADSGKLVLNAQAAPTNDRESMLKRGKEFFGRPAGADAAAKATDKN